MTATELLEVFASTEFRHDLEEISSYLASIMQERPIVYLTAKCLWKRGYKFELENKLTDLFVNEKRIEFKFNYSMCDGAILKGINRRDGDAESFLTDKSGNWLVAPKIARDICDKGAHLFVWIICSRDLANVQKDDLTRVCKGRQQRECGYNPDGSSLKNVDWLLGELQKARTFTVHSLDIHTAGDFPSTYHIRLCDFSSVQPDTLVTSTRSGP